MATRYEPTVPGSKVFFSFFLLLQNYRTYSRAQFKTKITGTFLKSASQVIQQNKFTKNAMYFFRILISCNVKLTALASLVQAPYSQAVNSLGSCVQVSPIAWCLKKSSLTIPIVEMWNIEINTNTIIFKINKWHNNIVSY